MNTADNQPGAANQERHKPIIRDGIVISDKMDKTIVVMVTRLMQHPQFKKFIRRKLKYAAHDEKNEAKVGDKVRIVQTRPMSKTKRWRLGSVLVKHSEETKEVKAP